MSTPAARPTPSPAASQPGSHAMPQTARLYIGAMIVTGLVTAFFALSDLMELASSRGLLFLAALTVLTSLAGIKFPLPTRRLTGSFGITISECFIFVGFLLVGPGAAVALALLEAVVGNLRFKVKRPERFLFNISQLALSAWLAAQVFGSLSGELDSAIAVFSFRFLGTIGICALLYFVVNTGSIALGMALVSSLSPRVTWRRNFPWASPSNLINAAAASILLISLDSTDTAQALLLGGLCFLLLATSWFYLRAGKKQRFSAATADS